MKKKPITEINVNALKKNHLAFGTTKDNPIEVNVTFYNHTDVINSINSILEAIAIIGRTENGNDLYICGSLAELGQKILPYDEAQFLDELLIKNTSSIPVQEFKTVENL